MTELTSNHFKANELRCHCSKCKTQEPNKINHEALTALERVRTELGESMVITSAYRCCNHPDEVKKKSPGQHNQGFAFDVSVGWGAKRIRITELALKHGFKGFGFSNSFLHLDYRKGIKTSWGYN
jgi:uncharacterized protein YcbK (DUF882 family)